MDDREQVFAKELEQMDNATLRQIFREAGEAYEYYGGHWTLSIVQREMQRRGMN